MNEHKYTNTHMYTHTYTHTHTDSLTNTTVKAGPYSTCTCININSKVYADKIAMGEHSNVMVSDALVYLRAIMDST